MMTNFWKSGGVVALVYFFVILIFSWIYWFLWTNDTSNFIIHEDYNVHTLKPYFPFEGVPDGTDIKIKGKSTKETNNLIEPIYDTLEELGAKLDSIDLVLYAVKARDSINHELLKISHEANTENFLSHSLDSVNQIIDSIIINEQRVNLSLKQILPDKKRYYDSLVYLYNLRYQIALNNVVASKIRYIAINSITKSWSKFYDDTLFTLSYKLYDTINILEGVQSTLQERSKKKAEEIRQLALDYYFYRTNKLKYLDFLYFSVISATSTGYGDILPNTTLIRFLVSMEVLISIITFGFYFYVISLKGNQLPLK